MSEMMSPAIMQALGGGQPAEEPAQEGGSALDLIRDALELVRQYAQQEQSEQNTLDAEKITTLLQGLLAAEEKEMDDAMQGKASPRVLRQAYGG